MRLALISALFLVPFAAPFLVRWVRARRWGLPVRVAMGPDAPRTEVLGDYLAEIARRLDERPERMRVVFDGGGSRDRAISLDVLPDRSLRVSVDGHRPRRVDLRGRWIADHPVPLSLRKAVLYVEPVDANRFRVRTRIPFSVPPLLYVLCSLAATVGIVWLVPELVAPSVGLALGSACVVHYPIPC